MKPAREDNYYKILGVQQCASQEEIKKAFNKERRVLPYNIEEARTKRALLDEAYFVLGNEIRRYSYDRSQLGHRKQEQLVDQPSAIQLIKTLITPFTKRLKTGLGITQPLGEFVKLRLNKGSVTIMLLLVLIFAITAAWPSGYDAIYNSAMLPGNYKSEVLTLDMSPKELPRNGETRYYISDLPVAPLVIESSAEGTNYLIKLIDEADGEKAMTIFVRGGERVETPVPLGCYELRYASGDQWYGEEFLFGESTVYMKANKKLNFYQHGQEITCRKISLINQFNKGLQLKRINQEKF